MKGFGPTISAFATESHELHRTRRGALAPFFSKASVYHLEPSVQAVVNKLISRLEGIQGSGVVINLIDVFTSLTADIICQYAFASPYGFMNEPDFAPHWHRAMMDVSETAHLFKQFGWIEPTMRKIPSNIVEMINPWLGALFSLEAVGERHIISISVHADKNLDGTPQNHRRQGRVYRRQKACRSEKHLL